MGEYSLNENNSARRKQKNLFPGLLYSLPSYDQKLTPAWPESIRFSTKSDHFVSAKAFLFVIAFRTNFLYFTIFAVPPKTPFPFINYPLGRFYPSLRFPLSPQRPLFPLGMPLQMKNLINPPSKIKEICENRTDSNYPPGSN